MHVHTPNACVRTYDATSRGSNVFRLYRPPSDIWHAGYVRSHTKVGAAERRCKERRSLCGSALPNTTSLHRFSRVQSGGTSQRTKKRRLETDRRRRAHEPPTTTTATATTTTTTTTTTTSRRASDSLIPPHFASTLTHLSMSNVSAP